MNEVHIKLLLIAASAVSPALLFLDDAAIRPTRDLDPQVARTVSRLSARAVCDIQKLVDLQSIAPNGDV
jgi:hypothetical protein